MRKLILQMQLTTDGLVAGPNGELDWMTWDWDDALKDYGTQLTESMDTIVMGRKMVKDFNAHWTKVAGDPNDESQEFGRTMMETPKYVFSKTVDQVEGKNTTVLKGDLEDEINRLKNQPGKNIIAYGGATLVGSLIKTGLIDDLHLFINPVIIGKGMSIFDQVTARQDLQLVKSKSFDCGIVVLHYIKKQG